jgi:hypothetical protein
MQVGYDVGFRRIARDIPQLVRIVNQVEELLVAVGVFDVLPGAKREGAVSLTWTLPSTT